MSQRYDYDVAIVGAGPVGVTLANLLGKAGRTVLLLDREPGIYRLPRAVHFDGEVMRAFQAAGLSDRLAQVARVSSKGMHFVSGSGQTLLIRRAYEGVGPHDWASNYYMHQPHLEAALREGLGRWPTVTPRYGTEVTALDMDSAGVTVSTRDIASGDTAEARARYVVGCDGGRSFVRRAIGTESEDLGLHQPWLVVDAIVDPASPRVRALPEHTIQLCDPARPMTIVYVGGERWRWEIMLMPGDDPDRMIEPASVWSLIARWILPEDGRLERAALYTFHSVIARSWRRDRLLLAGDACHQTPPFLGQGMCAGIRDALNLSWKLVRVLEGRSDDRLLDTYETERRPHVHAFIKLAVELGGIIQATDPQVVRARDASFADGTPRVFDYPQPQLGPGVHLDGPPPVGQVFPQPRLDNGRRLDDLTQGRFALVGEPALVGEARRRLTPLLAALDIAVVDAPSQRLSAWLATHGTRAVLLRPDAYVFATAGSLADLDHALVRLRGLLAEAAPATRPMTAETRGDRPC